MRWVVLLVMLATMPAMGALQYLTKSTPAHTNFDTGLSNTWDAPDDATHASISLGFSFPFNGTSYTDVYINANGMLSFTNNTAGSSTAHDRGLSSTTSPTSEYQIFPYWDDLYAPPSGQTNGQVKYGRLGANTADDRFVVEWDNVTHYLTRNDSNRPHFRFQVVLYKDGSIRFRYDSSSSADGHAYGGDTNDPGATIGVRESGNHYDESREGNGFDNTKDVLYTPVSPPSSSDYSDFHFDELSWNGTNGEVKDSSLHKDGTGHSVESVKGKICQAMDLTDNGVDDYADMDPQIVGNLGDFTVSLWMKTNQTSDGAIITAAKNGSNEDFLQLWMHSSNQLQLWLNSNTKPDVTFPANFKDNTWHHLVWRRENGQMCVFFDGSKTCPNHTLDNSAILADVFYVGQESDGVSTSTFNSGQDYEGLIDELLIFRRALSDSEIQTGYSNQNAGNNWDGTTRTCPYPSITKTSCVISDPVNNTTNPKRIPGAKIRYAIELSNPNTSSIQDAKADDSLSSYFENITIPKVVDSGCDCPNLSGGSNSGSVNGNNVQIDFGNVSGGTLSNPTKKCGYFEVEIK